MFLTTVQFLQTRDDLPDVRSGGERGTPVMRRTPENDAGVVELVDPLDDELIQQRGGGHALAGGTRSDGSIALIYLDLD